MPSCQSSLTIHQSFSTMTIPHGTTTNTPMLNNNSIKEKSSARFSYLIHPTTPSIFGTDNYDDQPTNDDEFFLTAGGIVHSCPNIYELNRENNIQRRRLQSCDHFRFINHQTTSVHHHLNTYDTQSNRYTIVPRFQPISSSLSTDSINSDIELYQERHAIGLFRKSTSSFLPSTTWKSENYLFFISIQSILTSNSNRTKRSRSYENFLR